VFHDRTFRNQTLDSTSLASGIEPSSNFEGGIATADSRSLLGVKRTSLFPLQMSANDPKRT
jgi:hypothetical protein